jgi:formiminotetrahydrofolate cyclodeaminase
MSADKDYLSLPLHELLTDIATKSPTPGGGSVAALVGSLSCSLACMVLQFTIGKPKFAEHEPHLKELLCDLTRAGEKFTSLMAEDMRAYEAVLAARKAEPQIREQASARATAVPMDIVMLAGSVAACIDELKSFVNPHLLGDLRASAVLAHAAARAAGGTVRDNLPSLPDREEAARIERQVEALVHQAENHCNSVARHVRPE